MAKRVSRRIKPHPHATSGPVPTYERLERLAKTHPLLALQDPDATREQIIRWLQRDKDTSPAEIAKSLEHNPAFPLLALENPENEDPILTAYWAGKKSEAFGDLERKTEGRSPEWMISFCYQVIQSVLPIYREAYPDDFYLESWVNQAYRDKHGDGLRRTQAIAIRSDAMRDGHLAAAYAASACVYFLDNLEEVETQQEPPSAFMYRIFGNVVSTATRSSMIHQCPDDGWLQERAGFLFLKECEDLISSTVGGKPKKKRGKVAGDWAAEDLRAASDPSTPPEELLKLLRDYPAAGPHSQVRPEVVRALAGNPNMPINTLLQIASVCPLGETFMALVQNPIWAMLPLENPAWVQEMLTFSVNKPYFDARPGLRRLLSYPETYPFYSYMGGRPYPATLRSWRILIYPNGLYARADETGSVLNLFPSRDALLYDIVMGWSHDKSLSASYDAALRKIEERAMDYFEASNPSTSPQRLKDLSEKYSVSIYPVGDATGYTLTLKALAGNPNMPIDYLLARASTCHNDILEVTANNPIFPMLFLEDQKWYSRYITQDQSSFSVEIGFQRLMQRTDLYFCTLFGEPRKIEIEGHTMYLYPSGLYAISDQFGNPCAFRTSPADMAEVLAHTLSGRFKFREKVRQIEKQIISAEKRKV